jgi:hypothetical protein
MKVSSVGSGASTSGAKRTAKTTSTGEFKQALADAIEPAGTAAPVERSAAAGVVDALFAIQSVEEPLEREARKRLVRRGEDILDRLEEIRHGLLIGSVPKDKLAALAQLVRSRREGCGDPRLAAVLDEIELRAEVELAKLSRHN